MKDSMEFKNFQTLLTFTYCLLPTVAGADKFTNLLTDWSKYLNPGRFYPGWNLRSYKR